MASPDMRRDTRPDVIVIGGVLSLHARLQRELAAIDEEFSLSRSQRSVILSLQENRRLGWLSRELHLSPPALTAIADGLAEKGLVERQPDPDDRRAVVLALSAQGRSVLEGLFGASSRIVHTVTGLDGADLVLLADLFVRMKLDAPPMSEAEES